MHLFNYIMLSSSLVPVFVGAYGFPRLGADMRILLGLLYIAVLVEFAGAFLYLYGLDYFWVQNIFLPIEYSLLVLVFAGWQRNRLVRKTMLYSIIVIDLLCIINLFILGNLTVFANRPMTFCCILYVVIAAFTLYNLQRHDQGAISENFRFWVASGLLVFAAGSLTYFALHDIVKEHYLVAVWQAHIIVNSISLGLYSVGFLCQIRQSV